MNPWLVSGLVVAAIPAAGLVALRRIFSVVRVRGGSMRPAFRPGELLLVRNKPGGRIRVGAVVIFRAPDLVPFESPGPRDKWLIKRISALPGDAVPEPAREATGGTPVVPGGMFTVSADNPDGNDSRQIGFLLIDQISGLVLRKLTTSDSPAK
jgi:signal peptidase I